MNWNQWVIWACLKLNKNKFLDSKKEAEIILRNVINKSYAQLLIFGKTLLTYQELIKLEDLVNRRTKGEPFAYLIGFKEFWSLNFKVSTGAFVPRPDTEHLVDRALSLLPVSSSNVHVLDLGTGVGTIALALASERPNWKIIGIERCKKALNFAYENKLLFGFKNVMFQSGNWFKFLNNKFDIIVSNPPYIDKNDVCLSHDGILFEPKHALVSKQSGLFDLTIICEYAVQYLNTNGWLILEHGWDQGKYMRKLFYKLGFTNIHTDLDYNNNERITYGQWII